jgi:IS30 family transposase
MAQHARFTAQTGITVYFADPYAPWQRGSNKNINGLLPEYFPKGSDLSSHRPEALAAVAQQLNNRPRKRLGFLTPAQVIAKLITEDQPAGVATID